MPRDPGSETSGSYPLASPFTLRPRLLTPLAAGGMSALDDALVVVDAAGCMTAVEPAARLDGHRVLRRQHAPPKEGGLSRTPDDKG